MKLLLEIKPYLIWSFTPVVIIMIGHVLYQLLGGDLGPYISIAYATIIITILVSLITNYKFSTTNKYDRYYSRNIVEIENYVLYKMELENYRKTLELKYKNLDKQSDPSLHNTNNSKSDLPLGSFSRGGSHLRWPDEQEQIDVIISMSNTIKSLGNEGKVSVDGKEYVFTTKIGKKSSIFDVFTLPFKEYIDLLIDIHHINANDDSKQNKVK